MTFPYRSKNAGDGIFTEDLGDFDDGRNDSTPEGWKEGGKEETVTDKGAKLKKLDQAHTSSQELQAQL